MKTALRGNLFVVCVLLNQLLVSVISPFFIPLLAQLSFDMPMVMIVVQLLYFVPPLALYFLLAKPDASLMRLRRLGMTNILLIVLMSLAIQPAMSVLSALSALFFENQVSSFMLGMTQSSWPVALVSVAVMPAIFEELTMRGVVLGNYAHVPLKRAAFANGVLFGILHLNPQQFLYSALLGVVFVYFVRHTGSVWAAVVAHFTINASQFLLVTASIKTLDSLPDDMGFTAAGDLLNTGIFFVVLNMIFLPVFALLFHTFVRHNKHAAAAAPVAQAEPIIPARAKERVVDLAFIASVLLYLIIVSMD